MTKKVIIVGGGFGGIKAAKLLGEHPDFFDIILIDQRNYHLFQPLLYQVATAGLSPADIAAPIRGILSEYKNITVLLDKVTSVDPTLKKIQTQEQTLNYDYLILACGATHSYFGKDQWEEFAPGLKTLEMATEIRRRILMAFEAAEKETDLRKQQKCLSFVVVGAGPTGVEMAGAISEIASQSMKKDFRNVRPSQAKIYLIEAGPRILASFDEELSTKALFDLKKLKVEVLLDTVVSDINGEGVQIKDSSDGQFIYAKTVIWAAGVKPSPLNAGLKSPMDESGRLVVTKDLSLTSHPETFVIGDQAHFALTSDKTLPGLAPVAIQEGACAAKNILRLTNGKPTKPFRYFDKGQMATIGRKLAVMEYHGLKASGMLAWLFVHIYYLIGFKNRLVVLFQWAWCYFTFSRGARLITKKDWKEN